jgi:hypothetical protein
MPAAFMQQFSAEGLQFLGLVPLSGAAPAPQTAQHAAAPVSATHLLLALASLLAPQEAGALQVEVFKVTPPGRLYSSR